MMRVIVCSVLFLIMFQASSQPGHKRVLFLGNSYTYVNDLPALTRDIAASVGDTLEIDSNTPGGYTFQMHTTNTTSLNKIMQGNWDFVILQEQSQLPSFPYSQVETECFPFAEFLDSVINQYNTCGETMFYMTWGRKNGDASNCALWPPVCTYNGMDSLLRLRYCMMADSNNAVVCPVGAVWHYLRTNYPSLELYAADESHPSPAGTYAAACAFYSAIFRKDPALISFNYSLSPFDAGIIRYAASKVVYDSLSYWNIGAYDPQASFGYNLFPNFLVEFNSTSQYADHFYWDFGDGTYSFSSAPSHQYAGPGLYIVKLIASKCSAYDTVVSQINVIQTDISARDKGIGESLVFPNPADDFLFVRVKGFNSPVRFIIVDNSGKRIRQGLLSIEINKIDIGLLAKGEYSMIIIDALDQQVTKKFLKH